MKLSRVIEQWSLLESAFHHVYGVDLEDVWAAKSWRWFQTRLTNILQSDTPLTRFFAPEPEAPDVGHPDR